MELMCFLPVRALPKPERLRYLFSFDLTILCSLLEALRKKGAFFQNHAHAPVAVWCSLGR